MIIIKPILKQLHWAQSVKIDFGNKNKTMFFILLVPYTLIFTGKATAFLILFLVSTMSGIDEYLSNDTVFPEES